MRILFAIGTMGGGGAERNVALLANALVNKGYDVGILGIWGDEMAYNIDARIAYIPLNPPSRNKLIKFIKQVYAIRGAIKNYAPDLVISFLADVNSVVLLRTRGMKCKVVVSERNDPHIDPSIWVFRVLRKLMYPFADGYVFQTVEARNYFKKILRHKSHVVIPNPVRQDLPLHQDRRSKIIVTACRLAKQKNLFMLIDAFEAVYRVHGDYKLHIYGEGELRGELQEYINTHNLHDSIELKGFATNVCERINEAEIFALASDYEGMSNSMLEALAMGMPVVVTDCPIGGARMLIKNNVNGILVPVGDVSAMAQGLLGLIENEERRKRLAFCARKIREDNSIENIIASWEKYILE